MKNIFKQIDCSLQMLIKKMSALQKVHKRKIDNLKKEQKERRSTEKKREEYVIK